jgi:hypothetical protein
MAAMRGQAAKEKCSPAGVDRCSGLLGLWRRAAKEKSSTAQDEPPFRVLTFRKQAAKRKTNSADEEKSKPAAKGKRATALPLMLSAILVATLSAIAPASTSALPLTSSRTHISAGVMSAPKIASETSPSYSKSRIRGSTPFLERCVSDLAELNEEGHQGWGLVWGEVASDSLYAAKEGAGRVFYVDPERNVIPGSRNLPENWTGEKVIVPEGHISSPRDLPLSEPPARVPGPFTTAERDAFLRGRAGTTRIAPHHRQQIPQRYGGVIDELPGPGHPAGNIHTAGSPTRHPNPSLFRRMRGGESLRAREIVEHFRAKGRRLIQVGPNEWIEP